MALPQGGGIRMIRLVNVVAALAVGWMLAEPALAARQVTGSGVSRTETRSAAGFQGVALGVDAALEIRQGPTEGLTITGDDNIVPLVETVVDHGVLQVRWTRGDYAATYKGLRIVV